MCFSHVLGNFLTQTEHFARAIAFKLWPFWQFSKCSYFSNIITIEFMFAGINMFWALLRLILARAAKMSLGRAQNIFMPENINSITINITLEGIEEIKT